jgi:hypothetical protein
MNQNKQVKQIIDTVLDCVNESGYNFDEDLAVTELTNQLNKIRQDVIEEEREKWRIVVEKVRQDPDLGGYSDEEIDEIIAIIKEK